MMQVILIGKARDVFKEFAKLVLWEKYGIGCRVFTISLIYLN